MTTTFDTIPQYTTSFSLQLIQDHVNNAFGDLEGSNPTTSLQTFVESINQKSIIFDKMSESYTEEIQREPVEYICVFLVNKTLNQLEIAMDSNLKKNAYNTTTTLYENFQDVFASGQNQEFGLKTVNTDSIIDHYIHITYTTTTTYTIGILIKTFPINVFVPPTTIMSSFGRRISVAPENARLIETPKHSYSNQFTKSY